MSTTRFWKNVHQIRSKPKDLKVFESKKTKGAKEESHIFISNVRK
jgi:hypothetical protein